jgi:hypothetical protein
MVLTISSSQIMVDDHVPFHVDRFSKNAVGLIVYMIEYLIGYDGQKRRTGEISSDVVFQHSYQYTSRNAFILCSEIPFNSTLYVYSFYFEPIITYIYSRCQVR